MNHRRLCHQFIVKFKEVVVTDRHLGVVMEYVSGGRVGTFPPHVIILQVSKHIQLMTAGVVLVM